MSPPAPVAPSHTVRVVIRGYVLKDVDVAELLHGIRAVGSGGSAFDPRSAAAPRSS